MGEEGAVEEAVVAGDVGPVGFAEVIDANPDELADHEGVVAEGAPGGGIGAVFGAKDFAGGVLFPGGDEFGFVVIFADDVHEFGEAALGIDALRVGAEECHGDGARAIERVVDIAHGSEAVFAGLGGEVVADFVAGGPEDDAGVVAIAEDHVAGVGLEIGVEEAVVALFGVGFGGGPGVEGFLHDEHAHLVAEVEEAGIDGIVGGADGVASERLHGGDAALPDGEGDGHADGAGVGVEADAEKFEVVAVEV